MKTAVDIGAEDIGKFGFAPDVNQKYDQNKREEAARQFEDPQGPAPATALLIVENGLAFRHKSIQARAVPTQRAYAQVQEFARLTAKAFLTVSGWIIKNLCSKTPEAAGW